MLFRSVMSHCRDSTRREHFPLPAYRTAYHGFAPVDSKPTCKFSYRLHIIIPWSAAAAHLHRERTARPWAEAHIAFGRIERQKAFAWLHHCHKRLARAKPQLKLAHRILPECAPDHPTTCPVRSKPHDESTCTVHMSPGLSLVSLDMRTLQSTSGESNSLRPT